MTPAEVLAAPDAVTAARRFHSWLKSQAESLGCNPKSIPLWSARKTGEMGYSKCWAVPWEEGPFEWTSIALGSSLLAGSTGVYSKPGPFPEGLCGKGWYAEIQNHWMLLFVAD